MNRKEQISTTVSLILIGLVLSAYIDLPARTLSIPGLLNPVLLSGHTPLLIILVALACAGQEIIIWSDFNTQEVRLNGSFVHWILPSTLTLAAGLIFPRISGLRAQTAGLIVTGLLLAATMEGEYRLVRPGDTGWAWLPLLMDTLTYIIALVLFAFILDALKPSVGRVLVVVGVTIVLSLRLFSLNQNASHAWWLAGLGIPIALASSILPALPLNMPSAAILLVVVFYVVVGLVRAHLCAALTRRVLTEYSLVLLAAIFLFLALSTQTR